MDTEDKTDTGDHATLNRDVEPFLQYYDNSELSETKPWFGACFSPQKVSFPGCPDTLLKIAYVVENFACYYAGIRDGDYLVSADTVQYPRNNDLSALSASHAIGDTILISVLREEKQWDGFLVFMARPFNDRIVQRPLIGRQIQPVEGVNLFERELCEACVRILFVFSTRCYYCAQATPAVRDLYSRYRASGLEIIGICTESAESITRYVNSMRMDFPVLQDTVNINIHQYRVLAVPHFVIIDKNDRIVSMYTGNTSFYFIENDIKALLEQ